MIRAMSKAMRVALVLSLPGLWGCGSPVGEACRQHLKEYAALPCTEGLEPGFDCRVFDDYPCDASAYFRCLSQEQRCDEDGQYQSGSSRCVELLACE